MIQPLKIGNVQLATNLLLAPIAGYCDVSFRLIPRACGGVGIFCLHRSAQPRRRASGKQAVDGFVRTIAWLYNRAMTTTTLPMRSTRSRRPRPIDVRHMEPACNGQACALARTTLQGRPVPGVHMTEAEYLNWCDEDVRSEWVDGEIIIMAPANDEHDDLNTWLTTLLRMYVEEHDQGIIRANMNVCLSGQRRFRVPDLFFVARDRQHLMRPAFFDGVPDAAVEFVSPDSQSRDRREKYEEYEKAGVREYWIIDPLSKTVELYRLDRKRFGRVSEVNDTLASSVIRGFHLRPSILWRRPLPKVASVLRQLASSKKS